MLPRARKVWREPGGKTKPTRVGPAQNIISDSVDGIFDARVTTRYYEHLPASPHSYSLFGSSISCFLESLFGSVSHCFPPTLQVPGFPWCGEKLSEYESLVGRRLHNPFGNFADRWRSFSPPLRLLADSFMVQWRRKRSLRSGLHGATCVLVTEIISQLKDMTSSDHE